VNDSTWIDLSDTMLFLRMDVLFSTENPLLLRGCTSCHLVSRMEGSFRNGSLGLLSIDLNVRRLNHSSWNGLSDTMLFLRMDVLLSTENPLLLRGRQPYQTRTLTCLIGRLFRILFSNSSRRSKIACKSTLTRVIPKRSFD
jgi:hypothetical protein